ncbi:MAG: hypothetical protein HY381_01785, partial [Candidatus Chisholmbacteria bacterium]|nr:hypothetical protein [Candidatus Chisholmbacteria bacterium]
KNEKLKHTIVLGGLLMVMIAEYRNVDWVKPFEISAEIKQFYSWLNQQAEVKVIVELPIANDLTNSSGWERSSYDDGQYLLYATLHNKALVNGHHSFIPGEVLRLGTRLTANFPTREKVDELRQMGVGVITVHEEEFADRRVGEKVINELRELGIEEAYNQGGLHGFRL